MALGGLRTSTLSALSLVQGTFPEQLCLPHAVLPGAPGSARASVTCPASRHLAAPCCPGQTLRSLRPGRASPCSLSPLLWCTATSQQEILWRTLTSPSSQWGGCWVPGSPAHRVPSVGGAWRPCGYAGSYLNPSIWADPSPPTLCCCGVWVGP